MVYTQCVFECTRSRSCHSSGWW